MCRSTYLSYLHQSIWIGKTVQIDSSNLSPSISFMSVVPLSLTPLTCNDFTVNIGWFKAVYWPRESPDDFFFNQLSHLLSWSQNTREHASINLWPSGEGPGRLEYIFYNRGSLGINIWVLKTSSAGLLTTVNVHASQHSASIQNGMSLTSWFIRRQCWSWFSNPSFFLFFFTKCQQVMEYMTQMA